MREFHDPCRFWAGKIPFDENTSVYIDFLVFLYRYDNHREQILRGSNTNYEEESLDIFPYFTAACYKGYDDDDSGFFMVYAKVFDQLASEDIEFMNSPDEYETVPKFGTSTSDYETVVGPFYAYWQSYCTKKTYTWLCPHNINEIRDRRILREVEKETKKIAQKKRKERNDEVRALVSFVRKRDKRVQEYRKKLEAKAEQNRMKQQLHRLSQLRKNQQVAQEMQKNQSNLFCVDHEEQLRQLEQAYCTGSENEGDDNEDNVMSDNSEISYNNDLYCVACNKTFKNISSLENHELSKKHRENAERLKKYMQTEDELYSNHQSVDNSGSEHDKLLLSNTESKKKANKKTKKLKKSSTQCICENDLLEHLNIGHISDTEKVDRWSDDDGKKKKKQKTKKSTKKVTPNVNDPEPESEPEPSSANKFPGNLYYL